MSGGRIMSSDYYSDFAAWADEQARALRAHRSGGNEPIDWEHLIEEVEGLAASDRRELRNRLRVTMVHLLKLRFGADPGPRAGWRETVVEQRRAIETLLDENTSMRKTVGSLVATLSARARQDAERALRDHGDGGVVDLTASLTEDQVLGDWWPDQES
jgi:hypothetical protein